MKQKNRNHETKRCISKRKFSRLFDANLDKAGFAYITKGWITQRSLRAVKIKNCVYAEFTATAKNASRLDTYHIRYKILEDYAEDFIAFSPFPIKLF